MISVVIPVQNGGSGLERCLDAVAAQEVDEETEVVIVDSGSTDGSQELARRRGARVEEIPAAEFNHGRTRNLGASLARGETVVFTVDDALPVGEHWLSTLVAPLRASPCLAGAYSRQIAYDDAPPYQRRYIDYRFGPSPRVQRAEGPGDLTVQSTLFSNVSSAVRREVFEHYPLRDDILIAEDLEWCGRVLLAGYEVAYVPASVVRHSHDYTLGALFKRYFDQGAAAGSTFHRAGRSSARGVRGEGVRYVGDELRWLWSTGGRRAIPSALAWELTRYAGYWLGTHQRRLPRRVRREFSRLPTYWD